MPEDPGRHAGAMPAIDGDIILKGICDTKAGRLTEGSRKPRRRKPRRCAYPLEDAEQMERCVSMPLFTHTLVDRQIEILEDPM